MKKTFLAICLALFGMVAAQAQTYALIDSEYILSSIPSYKKVTENMQEQAKSWQEQVKGIQEAAAQLYKDYQRDLPRLSDAAKVERENNIIAKEEEARELQMKYFGPKGEMAKLQEKHIKPLQDAIYEAVKLIASKRGYDLVLDRATASNIIFASPEADISNDVLQVLGVKK